MADDSDFVEFATARTPALLRTGWLLCGNWHQAQDLVQETLARMFSTWRRGGPDRLANPAAYAQVVLVRTYLSARRLRRFHEQPAELTGDDLPAHTEDATVRVAIAQALAQLAPRDRAVLVLRYLHDRSVDQVAADLGQSPSAVRTQSRRALHRLRTLIGDEQLADLARN
jgi:RNA polymerase sigma-70 factor (sigma-E family)